MVTLFQDIEEFKRFVGGDADADEAFLLSIAPKINHALSVHLAPWLGNALLKTVVDNYPEADETSKLFQLTELIQAALAPLALYEYSFTSSVKHNEMGLTRSESGSFRYQMDDYRNFQISSGYENLEACLIYLNQNAVDFSAWKDTEYHARHVSVFLNTASAFRTAYSSQISRYTFDILRGIIEDVELFAFRRTLPKQFLRDIKTKFKGNALVSPLEKELLLKLRKVVAFFTIQEALQRQFVTIKNGQISQIESVNDQSAHTHRSPSRSDMTQSAWYHEIWANAHIVALKDFLEENKADFPLAFSTQVGGTNTDIDAFGYVAQIDPNEMPKKESNGWAVL